MKVLSIGTDRKLFDEKSPVLDRMISYASKVEEIHIVVFTKKGHKEKKVGNLHIYPTNSISRFHYIFDAVKLGEEIIRIKSLSLKNSVLSTQDPFETGLVGYFLHKRHFLPMQVQIHTDFLSPHFNKGLINKLRGFLARFIVPKAQGIRVVSEVIKESIQHKFPKLNVAISVLPVYVDIQKILDYSPTKNLEKDFPNFKFIIFMASRIVKEKRIDLALVSLKKILKDFPQTGLVVAGSGPELNNLKHQAKRLGITSSVVFIGWQDDLISYFKTANLFLLTSEYEGYGMTLVEAGASGCPIVTTQVGLAKTDLFKNGENSLVCPVGDEECISQSVLSMIHDNTKREVFKRKMLDEIKLKNLNMDEYATLYIKLLEDLVSTY